MDREKTGQRNARELVNAAARQFLELVFPSNIYCVACGGIIDQTRPYALCDRCARAFHWANGRTCAKCGKILQDTYPRDICLDCRENARVFAKGYICVQYGMRERDLLLAFKYGGQAFVGEKLAEIMADRIAPEELDIDLIVPVPMHRRKQRRRGFNQADLMARRLAKKLSVPYAANLLLRTTDTPAMSKLNPVERRGNLEGAFGLAAGGERRVAGASILLVDDIYTTGSTGDACSETLLAGGAAEVRLISFAGGANRTASGLDD